MATKKKTTPSSTTGPSSTTATAAAETHSYDAIVIGGGHNGLVNGAYLAKAGLRTLILEQRHLVGEQASPRSCVPASPSPPSATR